MIWNDLYSVQINSEFSLLYEYESEIDWTMSLFHGFILFLLYSTS